MGKVIKIFSLIVLVLVISGLFIRIHVGEHQSALYKVFDVRTDGYYFHKFLGLIPKHIRQEYSKKLLESTDGVEVVCYFDKGSPINASVVFLKMGSKETFIKAYPFELLENHPTNEFDIQNRVSDLINLDVFNQYLKKFNVTNEKEVFDKYCYFLSILGESDNHRIIKNFTDIDSIIKKHPLDNTDALLNSGYSIINLDSFEFEESEEVVYCWFINHGLIEFKFAFEGGLLAKVESRTLGYLGNEFPSCC